MDQNNEVSRRQVKQTLTNYTRALNHSTRHYALNHKTSACRQAEAQALLDQFKRTIRFARPRDVPGLVLDQLPISADKVVIVFDSYGGTSQDDGCVVVIVRTNDTEIRWFNAKILIGCRHER